jgi:ABC-type multidrug transport system fused ATPase/permease subunit
VTKEGRSRGDDARLRHLRAAIRRELRADENDGYLRRGTLLAPAAGVSVMRRESPTGQTPVISLSHVSLAFEEPVVEDISLDVYRGETVVIVGESGTGKSTILKLVLRLLIPDSGRVLIDGRDIVGLSFDHALAERRRIGMVFQGAAPVPPRPHQ